jgi:hypothetical protein
MTRWGIVSTVKAPTRDILRFAAYHLDLGAHRLQLFLDDPDPDTYALLKAHPKIRVTACDDRHWRALTGKRPHKHQVRQTANATYAYGRAEVDWLTHVDVDEFLWPQTTVTEVLAALPDDVMTGRVRPAEALAPDTPDAHAPATCFKAIPVDRAARDRSTAALYPDYAAHIDDGFMSHVAGKIFLRTGLGEVAFRIHNVRQGAVQNPGQAEIPQIALLHVHARNWTDWRARFDYRHAKGAYRAELERAGPSGLTRHAFFAALIAAEGETGLRRFFDQVCLATPQHCEALKAQGLLRVHDLDLDARVAKHFPQMG